MKKILLSLGVVGLASAPIVSVVSCSETTNASELSLNTTDVKHMKEVITYLGGNPSKLKDEVKTIKGYEYKTGDKSFKGFAVQFIVGTDTKDLQQTATQKYDASVGDEIIFLAIPNKDNPKELDDTIKLITKSSSGTVAQNLTGEEKTRSEQLFEIADYLPGEEGTMTGGATVSGVFKHYASYGALMNAAFSDSDATRLANKPGFSQLKTAFEGVSLTQADAIAAIDTFNKSNIQVPLTVRVPQNTPQYIGVIGALAGVKVKAELFWQDTETVTKFVKAVADIGNAYQSGSAFDKVNNLNRIALHKLGIRFLKA